MIKQYNVTVNGTTYEVTVESAAGGRMASAPVSRAAAALPISGSTAPGCRRLHCCVSRLMLSPNRYPHPNPKLRSYKSSPDR